MQAGREEKADEETIALYKQIIRVTGNEGVNTARRLFEKILSKEEEHVDTFGELLVELIPLLNPEI